MAWDWQSEDCSGRQWEQGMGVGNAAAWGWATARVLRTSRQVPEDQGSHSIAAAWGGCRCQGPVPPRPSPDLWTLGARCPPLALAQGWPSLARDPREIPTPPQHNEAIKCCRLGLMSTGHTPRSVQKQPDAACCLLPRALLSSLFFFPPFFPYTSYLKRLQDTKIQHRPPHASDEKHLLPLEPSQQ